MNAQILLSLLIAAPSPGGRALPGDLTARTELAHSSAHIEVCAPPGTEEDRVDIRVVFVLHEGLAWREPALMPSTVSVSVDDGSDVTPPNPVLGPPEGRLNGRACHFSIRRPPGAARRVTLKVRYAAVSAHAGRVDRVLVDDATLQIDIPQRAEPSIAGDEEQDSRDAVRLPATERAPDTERSASRAGASPLLPALAFALSAILVFGGVAALIRRSRDR